MTARRCSCASSARPGARPAPVTLVATSPNLLVADPALGAPLTLADFVRVATTRPGQLNYGSVGNGSVAPGDGAVRAAPASLVHAPYQGFPQVVNAPLAGQVQAAPSWCRASRWARCARKLDALGVTTLGRVAASRRSRPWPSRASGLRGDLLAGCARAGEDAVGDRRPAVGRADPDHQERRGAHAHARPVLQRGGHRRRKRWNA